MQISKIAHVCLNVKNLERAVKWYSALGFTQKFDFVRKGKHFGAYLEISEGNFIELFENPDLDTVINNGIVHFCLESDNIDMLIRQMDEAGIAHTEKKLGCDSTWQIWLKDPDGNNFEIHQYTAGSAQKKGGVTLEADW